MKNVLAPILAVFALAGAAMPAAAEKITAPGFGDIAVYRPADEIASVAVFLSGAGGWDKPSAALTAQLTDSNTLMLAIDTPALVRDLGHGKTCALLAGTLQEIARSAEKQLNLPAYIEPMVVGYAEGATYAYAAVAEAPENTFKGGFGFSFAPKLTTERPLCKGQGLPPGEAAGTGYAIGKAKALSAPFTVLQGTADEVTAVADVHDFFQNMEGARIVDLDGAGHGFDKPDLFSDQLVDEYWQIAGTDSNFKPANVSNVSGLKDLPLTEVRDPKAVEGETFAIFISGDGGWADLDDGVSGELSKLGIPVVGVSSLKYFWQARTPEGVAADVSMIADHYLSAWHKHHVLLIGYSFGADVIPFAANRLGPVAKKALRGIALLGPSHTGSFEFHVSDWISDSNAGLATKPEVDKLAPLPVICIHGEEEDNSLCPDLKGKGVTNVLLTGGHHLGGDYTDVADKIAKLPMS